MKWLGCGAAMQLGGYLDGLINDGEMVAQLISHAGVSVLSLSGVAC